MTSACAKLALKAGVSRSHNLADSGKVQALASNDVPSSARKHIAVHAFVQNAYYKALWKQKTPPGLLKDAQAVAAYLSELYSLAPVFLAVICDALVWI